MWWSDLEDSCGIISKISLWVSAHRGPVSEGICLFAFIYYLMRFTGFFNLVLAFFLKPDIVINSLKIERN